MNYIALTPYLIPENLSKRVNAGDGFVLDACEKLIGSPASAYLSSWQALDEHAIGQINAAKFLLLPGTNRLKDDLLICPEFTLDTLGRIKVPIVLMGQGHYGVSASTKGLSAKSVALLEALLERFPLISTRCDESAAYVRRALPTRADHILMTSCPAACPVDGIDRGFQRKAEYECLTVTITDRSNLPQQLTFLKYVKTLIRAKRCVVALHQDYGNAEMKNFIRGLGFEVFASPDYKRYIDLYAQADIHIGNRLHAHLKCLSMGVVSYLLPFDLRQAYFAESLDFPLLSSFPNAEMETYDFARFRARLAVAERHMTKFLAAISRL